MQASRNSTSRSSTSRSSIRTSKAGVGEHVPLVTLGTLNPEPKPLNPQPQTLSLTLNPKPQDSEP